MAMNFTLHHHVARPISVHYHRPIARSIHLIIITVAVIFLAVKLWLFWLTYHFLTGSQLERLDVLLLIPFLAGVALIIGLTIYGEKVFYRELPYLQRKYAFKFEHAFRHK
jgi:hypothetical protein